MEKRPSSPRLAAWIPAILWMAIIFTFSQHPNIETGLSFDLALKKGAHLIEYGILVLVYYLGSNGSLLRWSFHHARNAWVLCVLFAASDEFHQSFIPTRSARPLDVLIDSIGAFLALAILRWAILDIPRKRKKAAL